MTHARPGSLFRAWACFALALLLCGVLPPGACRAADDTREEDKPAATETEQPEEAPLEVSISDRGLSVYAEGAQADEVFARLARAGGVGIIVDDTVGRREGDKFTSRQITLNLKSKSIGEIIEYICTAYGLSHAKVGSVFMISEGIPKNPSSYLMSDIASITTEYVPSAQVKSLLPEFLQTHVKVNEGQNAVILSAPAEVLAKFGRDIEPFDVPPMPPPGNWDSTSCGATRGRAHVHPRERGRSSSEFWTPSPTSSPPPSRPSRRGGRPECTRTPGSRL
jgi:hypothetical protein